MPENPLGDLLGAAGILLEMPWDADPRGVGARLMLSPRPQSQRAAALGVLFALIMLLIIYSSGNGNEVFPYSRLRGRARRPPDLRKWGVKSGYLPVCGNKVRAGQQGRASAVTRGLSCGSL